MITVILIEAATALVLAIIVMVLGYLAQKVAGALLLGTGALLGSGLVIAGTYLGARFGGNTGAWIGTLTGMAVSGVLLTVILGKLIRGKSGRFIAGVWFGFCGLAIFGYLAGNWVGLLLVTLPAVLIFWIGLYRISYYILPLSHKSERSRAFRCLVTFTMGTNYPYYFVNKTTNQPEKRVDGAPFLAFFAGPGFIYTGCEHAAYITNGIKANRVVGPGLNFTGQYELEPRIIDLKPQLRAFPVEALTRDGIPIKVVTFTPFRIDTGGKIVALGESFPFRPEAIHHALAGELVERKPDKHDEANGRKYTWDGGPYDGLVPAIATRIVQDIISRYTVDELAAPFNPEKDPRVEIAAEVRERVKEAIRPYGLELIGGGISNLIPQDEAVVQRRLDNWQTGWQQKTLARLSQGETEFMRQVQTARADAEAQVFARLSREIHQSGLSGAALASRFIDSLGEIVSEAKTQWPLPPGVRETWQRLRGELAANHPRPGNGQTERSK